MTDSRKEKPWLAGDAGSSAVAWLFALVMTAVLAFGAWYVLTLSGTAVDEDARIESGQGNAAAQLHLISAGHPDED